MDEKEESRLIGIIGHVGHGKTVLTRAITEALKTRQTEIEDHRPLEIVIIDVDGSRIPESNINRLGGLDDLAIQRRIPEPKIDRAVPMPRPYNKYGKQNR